jgi:hypothetical protein
VLKEVHFNGESVGDGLPKGVLIDTEEGCQFLVEDLVFMAEEVFAEFHEVCGLFEAEVEFFGNKEEVVVVDHVAGLLVEGL